MDLLAFKVSFEELCAIPGSSDFDFAAEAVRHMDMWPGFEDTVERVQEIVSGATEIDACELDSAIFAIYYHLSLPHMAPGSRYMTVIPGGQADIQRCQAALAYHGVAEIVRVFDWSRGSPLIPGLVGPHGSGGWRFAYMTPDEITSSAPILSTTDWAGETESYRETLVTLSAWIVEAAESQGVALVIGCGDAIVVQE